MSVKRSTEQNGGEGCILSASMAVQLATTHTVTRAVSSVLVQMQVLLVREQGVWGRASARQLSYRADKESAAVNRQDS